MLSGNRFAGFPSTVWLRPAGRISRPHCDASRGSTCICQAHVLTNTNSIAPMARDVYVWVVRTEDAFLNAASAARRKCGVLICPDMCRANLFNSMGSPQNHRFCGAGKALFRFHDTHFTPGEYPVFSHLTNPLQGFVYFFSGLLQGVPRPDILFMPHRKGRA